MFDMCCCYCFFFFKQKTAYEMRSSDWSSDVCSSDLVDFDTETLKARGIDPKLADYFRLAPKFTQGEHVVTLRVNGMKVGRVSAKLGRASCRERVCQYV